MKRWKASCKCPIKLSSPPSLLSCEETAFPPSKENSNKVSPWKAERGPHIRHQISLWFCYIQVTGSFPKHHGVQTQMSKQRPFIQAKACTLCVSDAAVWLESAESGQGRVFFLIIVEVGVRIFIRLRIPDWLTCV